MKVVVVGAAGGGASASDSVSRSPVVSSSLDTRDFSCPVSYLSSQ